ncbi:MAG TPA: glycosyltransferase [Thermoanaerobaculia bacterium]|nr:glycosyltransferase [Thermoanaerobaculia bacterium]
MPERARTTDASSSPGSPGGAAAAPEFRSRAAAAGDERPLSILEVVVRFFPYVGGVENTVYELSRRLVRRGHRVRVVCAAEPAGAPSNVEGIAVDRLPWRGKVGNANLCRGLRRAARDAAAEIGADLVHAHLPTALFPEAAAAAARARRVPLVFTYNNDQVVPGPLGLLGRLYHRLVLPAVLRRAAAIVVPNAEYPRASPYLRSHLDRIVSIPWAVDLERFRPAPEPRRPPLIVGYLALLDRLHRYKGLEDLLRGAAAAVRDGAGLRLRIGGTGNALPAHRALAAELGLADRIEWLGFVPKAKLPAFFAGLHLFALPSRNLRQEGFGLVALEAMASGRPVLTTPVAAVAADLQRHEAGIVVPPHSPAAIAEALGAAAAGTLPLAAMGTRARRLAEERYGWESVADAYESLFHRLRAR